MSTVYADTLEPTVPTKDITLGATGDSITIGANSINTNVIQDSGGNVLFQSDGSGTLSNVNSAFSADLKLLSTETASGASSVSFTSGIDSTYDVYIFKFIDVNLSNQGANLTINFSSDGGSNYNMTKTTTYFGAYHQEDDSGTPALQYEASHDLAQSTSYQRIPTDLSNASDANADGNFYLFSPSSTTYVKHFYSTFQWQGGNEGTGSNYSANAFIAGYVNSTSAVNAVDIKPDAGTMDGVIKMYGL